MFARASTFLPRLGSSARGLAYAGTKNGYFGFRSRWQEARFAALGPGHGCGYFNSRGFRHAHPTAGAS